MADFAGILLYDSIICRLCGVENTEGIYLYDNENELDFKALINRYLPLEIEDDGKLPRTICPGCNIQLESTIQFFDLLVEGQKKIRELWKLEVNTRKRLEKEKQTLVDSLEGTTKFSLVTDENDDNIGDNGIFIKILPDGTFFGDEHEMTLKIRGLDKPKRKRGRPKKVKPDTEVEQVEQVPETTESEFMKEQEEESECDENGRKRRRRKVPQRFMEAVQGKELDRILREEGAIDGNESDDADDEEPNMADNKNELKGDGGEEVAGEVIGHIETPDGNIAEQIIAPVVGRGQYRRKKVTKFVCDFCGQSFKDRTRWIRHRITHKGMKFQCSQELCLKKFSSRNKLKLHQKTTGHEGEDIIENDLENLKTKKLSKQKVCCKYCSKYFISNASLSSHISTDHPGEVNDVVLDEKETVKSDDQGELQENTLTNFKVLYNALETDPEERIETNEDKEAKKKIKKENNGKLYVCDECERTFNHPSSLMYHKESVHNDGRRFVCSKCGKSFTHKQLLQRHQMVHSDSRPFPCPDCGIRFKTKSNLFNHKVVHTGEKKFSCHICEQQFAHKTSLTLHERWHKGQRPFQCPTCKKRFTQNGNLQEHMRIHSGTKPYGCEYCGKHFTTSSQHKLHVKRHTGDRPWKCSHCGKSFLHKDTWKTHERRHTGEKPFQCTFCKRGFAEHWSLKKHVRLHTGEKPYKCLTCGKEFADCSNLTKHRKVHSGPKIDNTVWSIIKSHLIDGISQPEQPEDVQQIIYVTYQDNEEGNDGKTLHLVDNIAGVTNDEIRFETEKEIMDVTSMADPNQTVDYKMDASESLQSHVGVTDEEGNPVQLTMPDGRAIEIVSMDTDSHVVQVKTLEGPRVFIQLPKNQEISEAELVERIQEAVLEEFSKPKFQKSILLPNVQRDMEDSEIEVNGQVLTEDILSTAQIISEGGTIQLEGEGPKPLELVTEFEIDSYKKINEYLATQQC
ncbi:hypothetical protein RUM43_008819 [Polyplax serrata]|uniref:Uncharacterized protein n=1 Tax=Polyplax serrata TaxID=468196 RepID=A0AAN8S884_POLSC